MISLWEKTSVNGLRGGINKNSRDRINKNLMIEHMEINNEPVLVNKLRLLNHGRYIQI